MFNINNKLILYLFMKNRLDYRAQLSRHSHDVSAGYTSSLTTGPIVPQYFHIMGPGDKIYFNHHMFARLQDVVTAFLGEIDIHIDSFFVPLQMLYTPFGQLFAQTDDLITSLFNVTSFDSTKGFPLLDLDNSILSDITSPELDATGQDSWLRCVFRLFDSLDVNPLAVVSNDVMEDYGHSQAATDIDDLICHNPKVAPWLFAAYQAIYQKSYRNDEFERLKVSSYNFDISYTDEFFVNQDLITLRFCQRPSDYFTNVRVSPISSAVNRFGEEDASFPSDGGSLDSQLLRVESFLDQSNIAINYSDITSPLSPTYTPFKAGSIYELAGSSTPQISASNIRSLFAVDKFARIYGRADKTYDDQILAHFGIKIPHDVKHDITRISQYRMVLQSDPIYGTANTTDAQANDVITTLGQVGGQGSVDFNSKQDTFEAPVHGVFMVVAYAVAKPRYIGTFSKLHLLTNRLSFPIPEYDKLGAEPMYRFEANPISLVAQSGWNPSSRIGWINRYSCFKQKYNRASLTYYGGNYGHGNINMNSYGPWVISRFPFNFGFNDTNNLPTSQQGSRFVSALAFFEDVTSLNNIMVKKYDRNFSDSYFGAPHMILQNDPILTEYMCNAKLVSWMSETGEPDL